MKIDFVIPNYILSPIPNSFAYNKHDCGVRIVGKTCFVLYKLKADRTIDEKYAVYRRFNNKHKRHRGWKFKLRISDELKEELGITCLKTIN